MEKQPIKLLVVDDERDMGTFVCNVAQGLGFSTASAGNTREFAQFFNRKTDVIVLDLFMPDMDGVELIRFLAENKSTAALILMTGVDKSVLHSAEQLAKEHGLNVLGALSKPFRKIELTKLLEKYSRSSGDIFTTSNDLPSAEELKKAIEDRQLTLVYQPQISRRGFAGVEVLARWRHPVKGMIPPNFFIPLSEKTGLIEDLTVFVLEESFKQWRLWRDQGIELRLSVNMSPKTLKDLDIPDRISSMINQLDLDPAKLVIEVTETALMENLIKYLEILTRLRMKGFHLSIDDFGTGYSSMQQLVRVPFNKLKIDQTFITNLDSDSECRAITKTSIALAHELGMEVVAEGIETRAVWDLLCEMGCDEGQGYWIGRPMESEKFVDWLRTEKFKRE